MKLSSLLDPKEKAILEAQMTEMANLYPASTGLSYAVWFGEVGGQHGPRIKVSNVKGKFDQNDNFVISVEKEPKLLTPSSMRIKRSELEDLFDWVKLNYDDLMEMWKIYETGDGRPEEIILGLKKI
jgi:hypothetical protein